MRTLPVEKPQELAYIEWTKGAMRSGWYSTRSARFTYALWERLQARPKAFSKTMAWSATQFNLAQGGEARYAEGLYVSADFFSVQGVPVTLGRTFTRVVAWSQCLEKEASSLDTARVRRSELTWL